MAAIKIKKNELVLERVQAGAMYDEAYMGYNAIFKGSFKTADLYVDYSLVHEDEDGKYMSSIAGVSFSSDWESLNREISNLIDEGFHGSIDVWEMIPPFENYSDKFTNTFADYMSA